MGATKGISCLETLLIGRRLEAGGWPFFQSEQASIEATCVAILSLGATPDDGGVSNFNFRSNTVPVEKGTETLLIQPVVPPDPEA
jgi:hypothetical protein